MSDTPVLTGEVVGYRQWRVTPDLELRAAAHRQRDTWSTGDNEAVCRRLDTDHAGLVVELGRGSPSPCGDTPGEDCECGFYGLHDPNSFWYGQSANASGFGFLTVPERDPDPLVSGVIVGWGKLQVHHEGFRCEFARVAAVAIPASKRDAVVARAVAAAYDVPCVPTTALPKIADEFGSTVPDDLRPAAPERSDLVFRFRMPAVAFQFYPVSPSPGFSHWVAGSAAPPVAPPGPKIVVPATWGAWQTALEEAIETSTPGDCKISELITARGPSNRQGPPRPKRPPRKLGW